MTTTCTKHDHNDHATTTTTTNRDPPPTTTIDDHPHPTTTIDDRLHPTTHHQIRQQTPRGATSLSATRQPNDERRHRRSSLLR
jgi:hypothetical protein